MKQGAGWFADPRPRAEEGARFRWWDGAQWTAWIADRGDAPPPPLVASASEPTADASTEPDPDTRTDAPAESDPEPTAPVADSKPVRVPVAVAATVATLAFALLAVGATVSATDAETASGPALPPPSVPQNATFAYRSSDRQLVLGELSVTMPGAPWTCDVRPRTIEGYLSQGLACSAVVHENYAGDRDSYANLVVGLAGDDLVRNDPIATAQEFQVRVRQRLFSQRTTVSDTVTPDTPYGPADRVARLRSRLNYRVSDLPSRYDTVDTLVVRLRSGETAVIFSNLADDAPAAMRRAFTATYDSIAVSG